MTKARYEFTGETKTLACGTLVRRIRALQMIPAFHDSDNAVEEGEIGGWIEGEHNLPRYEGHAWVGNDAVVYDQACVTEYGRVLNEAHVYGHAKVHGHARAYGLSRIYGISNVGGNSSVNHSALVFGDTRMVGTSTVRDWAKVSDSNLSGNAHVAGHAQVVASTLRNEVIVTNEAVVTNSRLNDNARVSGRAQLFSATMRDDARVGAYAKVQDRILCLNIDVTQDVIKYRPIFIHGMKYMITFMDEYMEVGCQCHTFEDWRNFSEDRIHAMDGQDALDFIGPLRAIMEGVLATRK